MSSCPAASLLRQKARHSKPVVSAYLKGLNLDTNCLMFPAKISKVILQAMQILQMSYSCINYQHYLPKRKDNTIKKQKSGILFWITLSFSESLLQTLQTKVSAIIHHSARTTTTGTKAYLKEICICLMMFPSSFNDLFIIVFVEFISCHHFTTLNGLHVM